MYKPPIVEMTNRASAERQHSETLLHRDLTDQIIGVFYAVYNELGFGFLESVYESAFAIALETAGHSVQRQVGMAVWFRGINVGDFRADLIVDHAVIIEVKAVRILEAAHEAQILNYLRCTNLEVGLLFNFGPRPAFKRMAFANERKGIRVHPR